MLTALPGKLRLSSQCVVFLAKLHDLLARNIIVH